MQEIKDIMLALTGEEPYEDDPVGKELRYKCPFCGSPKYKFYTDGSAFICFNCSRKGSFLSLVEALTGNHSYGGAKQWLKEHQYDIPQVVEAENVSDDLFTQISVLTSNDDSHKVDLSSLSMPQPPTNCHYLMNDFNNPVSYPYFNYAKKRGLSLKDIKHFHISYVTNGTFIKKSGRRSPITDSLVFFAYRHNKPIYWNTRNIYNEVPKSLNAPARSREYSRKETVFNLDYSSSQQDLIICEGIFNALTVNTKATRGVATYGKNISDEQFQLLAHSNFHHCFIALDSDAFSLASSYYRKLVSLGVPWDKVSIVDDRVLGSKDFNDVGRLKSLKLIYGRSYRPTVYSKLEAMLK